MEHQDRQMRTGSMLDFEPLWGTWTLEEVLGAGSFGTVYRAKQTFFGQTYYSAIKHISIPRDEAELRMVRDELATDDEETLTDYYDREVQSIAREFHIQKQFSDRPNFVHVSDFLPIRKKNMPGYDLFIRMELLNSIRPRFQTDSDREREALKLGIDICTALSEMHALHYIHRDIKLQNILVTDDGVYKLADFGTARKMTGAATYMSMKGSMDYIAPEIFRGEQVGYTADLYSLGLVLYRVLNHWKLPFAGDDASQELTGQAVVRRIAGDPLPPPSEASEKMAQVILKACAFHPSDRFQNAQEMLKALIRIQESVSSEQEKAYTEQMAALLEELAACEKKIGAVRTTSALRKIETALLKMDQNRPECASALERCRDLLQKQKQALAEKKKQTAGQEKESGTKEAEEDGKEKSDQDASLQELRTKIQECEKHLGMPSTSAKLGKILQMLTEMENEDPAVRDVLSYGEEVRTRHEKALQEKKQAAAMEKIQQELLACKEKIGQKETGAKLKQIARKLETLDQKSREWKERKDLCTSLQKEQEKAVQTQELKEIHQLLLSCQGEIGKAETTKRLNQAVGKLGSISKSIPEWKTVRDLCTELQKAQEKALAEEEMRRKPIPKGVSACVKWGWLVYLFAFYLLLAIALEAFPVLTAEPAGVVCMFVVPVLFARFAYVYSGCSFKAKMASKGKIRCTWKSKPGKTYGIILNGEWMTQRAVSPCTIEVQETANAVWLVEMGEKPRILKKTVLSQVSGKAAA